jgi:predicted permease
MVMISLIHDLRYSWRLLGRSPGFAAVAILSIALGIGANIAIFSLMNAFVLRLLPVPNPQQLIFVERASAQGGVERDFPYQVFEQLRDHNRTLESSCAFDDTNISLSIDGQPEMAPAEFDSASIFPLLGAHPLLGRVFTAVEDHPGGPQVVVISYAYWNRRFARDRTALGKQVMLKRMPFTIVGIMPPEFLGRRTAGSAPSLWIPMAWQPQLRLKDHDTFEIMARLNPGVSAEHARQDLNVIYQQFLKTAPGPRPGAQTIYVESAAHGERHQALASELRLLMVAVGLLLLIACSNVANLMLARATNRQREIALRVSLGATRWRLVRQLLIESLIVALAGGICGLFLARWGADFLGSAMRLDPVEFQPDRVLGFTALITIATGFLSGLIPALRSSSALATRSSRRRGAFDSTLVVVQIALSLVLVAGASLLTRSLMKLFSTDVGFERDQVLVAAAIPTFLGYEGEKELRLYETLLDRMNAVPGVDSATLSRFRLFQGHWERPFTVSAKPATSNSPEAFWHPIGPRFFETMRIPKLLGREFLPSDQAHAPLVAIVNEQLARTQFPGANPLGRMVRAEEGDPYTIVGVVQNVKQVSMREDPPRMAVYIPYTQTPPEMLGQINFEIRTAGSPLIVSAGLRRAVRAVDPDLPLLDLETQAEAIAAHMDDERALAKLVSLFGALALLLATVGLYGTMSYSLARRTSEIGIRMAVGAARSDVVQMVLRETFQMVLAGFAIGVPLALAGSRLIANRLFGVTPADPTTFLLAAALLAAVALIAACIPANRAARVDPLVAVRWE